MYKKIITTFFTIGFIAVGLFGIKAHAQADVSSGGWKKINETTIMLYDSGNNLIVGWKNDYHFNNSSPSKYGYMDYGWYTDNTGTYFLNTTIGEDFGKKVRGWQWIDGYRYYFDDNGRLVYNMNTQGTDNLTNEKGQWVLGGAVQFIANQGLKSDPHAKTGTTVQSVGISVQSSGTRTSPFAESLEVSKKAGNSQTASTQSNGETLGLIASPRASVQSGVSNYVSPPNETVAQVSIQFMSDILIIETKENVSADYVRNAVAPYSGSIDKAYESISTYRIKFGTINSTTRLIEIKNALQLDSNFNNVYLDMILNNNP